MEKSVSTNKKGLRIIVASDSHGHHELLERIVAFEREKASVDNKSLLFLHAGDSQARYQDEIEDWLSVKGNMDSASFLPFYRIITLPKHKIFITHGHLYSNSSISSIMKENACDICITGHTHVPSIQNRNGIYFLNPGSVARPRFTSKKQYLSLDLEDDGNIKITTKFIEEIL